MEKVKLLYFWCASFIHIHPYRDVTQLNKDIQFYKYHLATAPPVLRLNLHSYDETRKSFGYRMEHTPVACYEISHITIQKEDD